MLPRSIFRNVALLFLLLLLSSNSVHVDREGGQELVLIVFGFILLLLLPLIALIICVILRIATKKSVYAAGIYAGLGLPSVYFGLLYIEADGRHPEYLQYGAMGMGLLLIYLVIEIIIFRKKKR